MFYLATNNNQNEDGDGNDISASVKQREVFCLKSVRGLQRWSPSGEVGLFPFPRVLSPRLKNIEVQMLEASVCLA